ncbi:putative [Leishmania donovani]|nr:putative [Leishmania donovani]
MIQFIDTIASEAEEEEHWRWHERAA